MGNLYMSVLLRPKCDAAKAGQLSFVAVVALSAAMDEVVDEKHTKKLKWPNDILIDGKKVSGILIEKAGNAYVLGMGINIMNPPDEGISLNEVTWEIQIAIHPFRDKVLEKLKHYYGLWQQEGFAPIRKLWLAQAHSKGDRLKVNLGQDEVEGGFEDLDEAGHLILLDDDGQKIDISSGEVYFAAS